MPGFPGVFIGQSRHFAWTFTNVMADVQDLFVERIREGQNGGGPQYEFEGEWRPLERAPRGDRRCAAASEPEVLEVRETHHGPIVNDALGAAAGIAAARPGLDRAARAVLQPHGARRRLRAPRTRGGRELRRVPRALHEHAVGRLERQHRLQARRQAAAAAAATAPTCRSPAGPASTSGTATCPTPSCPRSTNPPGGVLVTANNRIAPADYPHHITSEYLDGWRAAAHRAAAGRARQALARRLRAHPARRLLDPGRADRPPARAPAAARPARGARDRAAEELGPPARRATRSPGRSTTFFTHHFAVLVSEAAIGDADDAERWRSKSQLGFTPMNSRAVALPRAAARAVGRGRPRR